MIDTTSSRKRGREEHLRIANNAATVPPQPVQSHDVSPNAGSGSDILNAWALRVRP